MQAREKKGGQKPIVEKEYSKYAGKPLNSVKEGAARRFEGAAMHILKHSAKAK